MNRSTQRLALLAGFFLLQATGSGAAGCLLEDERCGPYQVEQRQDNVALCVCADNAVPREDNHACTPCAEHEIAQGGSCVCETGFVRTAIDQPCEQSAIGAECGDGQECPDAYPYCFTSSAPVGYCTSAGCEHNSDCPGNWTCEREGSERICEPLPSGLNQHCTTDDDCAGSEATFCERFQTNTCMQQNCATGATRCPNEWGCCDYTRLLGVSLCLQPDQVSAGECPSGGTLVTP